jgi:TRAP transporter TAXI family solute receptor
MKNLHILFLILLAGFLLFPSCDREREEPAFEAPTGAPRWVSIGTDEATGLSHATGLAIAKIAEDKLEELAFRVRVKTTDGPVSSLNAVDAGDLDFAVVRSDILYEATRGYGPWAAQGPQTDLLAVFTAHAESVSLLAADDAGIETLEDLKGKRVNIGEPGSKDRRSSVHVLENAGLDIETDLRAEEARTADAPGMLQDGRIDALFCTTEHPNDLVKSAFAGARKIRFVPISNVRRILLRFPYYIQTRIPAQSYPGAVNKEDVPSIGYKISLVTSARVPNDLVSGILGEVFDNIEDLRGLHPAYRSLTKEYMTEGMYRMIHRGALYYYMKNGYRLSCCF